MINKIFVGLPVKDIKRSVDFYQALGFRLDENFSSEDMASLHLSDTIALSLFTPESFYGSPITPDLPEDSLKAVSNALEVEDKEAVDDLISRALGRGGVSFIIPSQPMYMKGFFDPDGHLWTIYTLT